jgi:hypothetical protein
VSRSILAQALQNQARRGASARGARLRAIKEEWLAAAVALFKYRALSRNARFAVRRVDRATKGSRVHAIVRVHTLALQKTFTYALRSRATLFEVHM